MMIMNTLSWTTFWDSAESRDALQLHLGPCEDVLSESDSDSEGELDEEGDAEDATLLDFVATLQKAHDISAAAEKEKKQLGEDLGITWGIPRGLKSDMHKNTKSYHKSKTINSSLISSTKRTKRMILLL